MLDRTSYTLSATEAEQLDRDGYVVRQAVFDADEVAAIARDCETLVGDLQAARQSTKHKIGSYMFQLHRAVGTVVKWEPDAPDVVQGIEPFAHFSPALNDWGLDARLVDPCKSVVGADDLVLFTEKLNVKRARHGGPIVLHQDYPY